MVRPESYCLPIRLAGEILWGRRGLVKTMGLWLPLALMVSMAGPSGGDGPLLTCLRVFATVACWSVATILTNDLTDREADLAAGKVRVMSLLPVGAGILIASALFGLGMLNLILAGGGPGALGAYLAAAVLGVLYSVRPVRLKERGVLGPLTYSASAAIAYVVLPWQWTDANWWLPAALAPAVLLDKWVNLHFHQVVDHEADRSAGTRTLAATAGLERARLTLRRLAAASSLALLGVIALVAIRQPLWGLGMAAICAAVVLGVALYTRLSRRRSGDSSSLARELPWHYLGLTYAAFRVLPIMLLARLALLWPSTWLVVGIVASLVMLESGQLVRYTHR